MLNLLQEVAIMSANGGPVARLSNVMDGVDGAATFGYSVEEGSFAIEDNQKVQRYHDHTLDIRLLNDPAAEAIIDNIIDGDGKAYIAGYTPDGFLCFNDSVIIARNPQFDQNIVSAFSARKRTLCGYTEGDFGFYKPIYAGRNLLALYDVTRARNTSQGSVISGFKATSGYRFTFAGGLQNVSIRSSERESLLWHKFSDLFFPFPVLINLAVDVVNPTSKVTIRLNFDDKDGNNISQAFTTISTTGTAKVSAAVPNGTVFVSVWLAIGELFTFLEESFSFKHPRITRGSNTKFSL